MEGEERQNELHGLSHNTTNESVVMEGEERQNELHGPSLSTWVAMSVSKNPLKIIVNHR